MDVNIRAALGAVIVPFAAISAGVEVPTHFEQNLGQSAPHVDFVHRGRGFQLFLSRDGATVQTALSTSRMVLKNALGGPGGMGLDDKGALSHYPALKISGARHYGRVRYKSVYPGIDLVYYGSAGELEYDFEVAPFADPSSIRLRFEGGAPPRSSADGGLELDGGIRLRKPVLYQETRQGRVPVDGSFQIAGREASFKVGAYRRDLPLVIDPILTYSAYFGGSASDQAGSFGLDGTGAMYLSGLTSSSDLPVSAGNPASPVPPNCFVAKLKPTGVLDWISYLPANSDFTDPKTCRVSVNAAGDTALLGVARNLQPTPGAASEGGAVIRLKRDGSGYQWVAGLMQSPNAVGRLLVTADGGVIAVLAAGVLPPTPSVGGGYVPPDRGSPEIVLTRLSAANGSIVWRGALGKRGATALLADAELDSAGNPVVAAYYSGQLDPLTGDLGTQLQTYRSGAGTHISKLSADGQTLLSQSILGLHFGVQDMVIGPGDDIWLTALSNSTLKVTPGSYNVRETPGTNPGSVALARLSPNADAIRFVTHIANAWVGGVMFVTVGGTGEATVGGQSWGPVSTGSFQPWAGGGDEIQLLRIDGTGKTLRWSTWFGGSGADRIVGLANESDGTVVMAGTTRSADFPLNGGTGSRAGDVDIFVSKVADSLISCGYTVATPTVVPAAGGPGTLAVTAVSGCAWTATGPEHWRVSRASGGLGSGTVNFVATPNETAVPVTVELTVAGQIVKVQQAGAACNLTASISTESEVPSAGRDITVSVGGGPFGCAWTATSNTPWIVLVGKGDMSASFRVEANPAYTARTGTITVAGRTFTVRQSGVPCAFTFDTPVRNSVPTNGTKASFTVSSPCPLTWEAQSNSPWIQVYPLSGAAGTPVTVTVFPNFDVSRSGTITFRSSTHTGGANVFVDQAGATGTPEQRFVGSLYYSAFGRFGSPEEIAGHVAARTPPAALVDAFLSTEEFVIGAKFVAGLYVGLLGRDAEYGGWLFQRNAMATMGATPHGLVSNFLNGGEFALRNGALDNSGFVRLLYRQILGREATQAEVDFQSTHLVGPEARVNFAVSFLRGAEFRLRAGPRLTTFLFYALLRQRDPTKEQFDAMATRIAAGVSVRTLLDEFFAPWTTP